MCGKRHTTLLSAHPTQYNVHSRDLQSTEETCVYEKRPTKETYRCEERHAKETYKFEKRSKILLPAHIRQRALHERDLQYTEETHICEKRPTKETYVCPKMTLVRRDLFERTETYKGDLHMSIETYNAHTILYKATHFTIKRPTIFRRNLRA